MTIPRRARSHATSIVALLTLALLALFALVACGGDDGTTSTPSGSAAAATSTDETSTATLVETDRLVVADYQASIVYVYAVPGYELIATFEGVRMEDHAGFLTLDDGRVLFVDRASSELVALDIAAATPEIVDRVGIPGRAIHLAVDPDLQHVAVSTSAGDDNSGRDAISVFALADFAPVAEVTVTTAEPGVILGRDVILHRDGAERGRMESFSLASAREGNTTPASFVDVGAWGHGEAFGAGHAYVATDEGLEKLHLHDDEVEHEGVIPWDVDGRSGGRAYYVRVVGSERPYLWSYLRAQASDAWGDWTNDIYVVDLETGDAHRHPLGNGLAFRLAVSDSRVMYARMHPDGYVAHIVDADPHSDTFMQVLHQVALTTPTQAPSSDASMDAVWASPGRPIAALTPDGTVGFVSRGGDGIIDVIDVAAGSVTQEIQLPTSLDGGGYLAVARLGVPVADGNGR